MATAAAVAAAVALGLGLYLGEGPVIPFADLPPEMQARINQNLKEARLFASLNQLDPAVQLL